MDPSRTSSASARPTATTSADRFGRVMKRFKIKLGSPPPEEISPATQTSTSANVTNRPPPPSLSARPCSPQTPNISSLTFSEPIIAAGDADDDALLYEEDYNTLLRDAQFRARPRPLFDRYGLDFERSGLTVSPHNPAEIPRARVLRAEKSVRVRVRYNCCQCEKTFGSAPRCSGCDHDRCKQCPRYPPRKRCGPTKSTEELREANPPPILIEALAAAPRVAEQSFKSPMYIHMPSRANYQAMQPPPVMINRLRRICHMCDQHFISPTAPVCHSCGHHACMACLRDSTAFLKRRRSSSGSVESDSAGIELTSQPLPAQQSSSITALRTPAQRNNENLSCDRCDADFVYGLQVCGNCLHEECDTCARRARRSPSATSSEGSSSAFAGEIGGSIGLAAV